MANQFIQRGKNMVHVNDILKEKKNTVKEITVRMFSPSEMDKFIAPLSGIEDAVSIEDMIVSGTNDVVTENVEELRSQYLEKFQKEVPVPKKNNAEWIKSKLA